MRWHPAGVDIEGVLRQQAGVISRAQAVAAGLSDDRIARRVNGGAWRRVHPGVYLAADREFGVEARCRAAALWAGDGATVSGVAAAWWLGLWPDPPARVETTVPERSGLRSRPGLLVRRRDLDWRDRLERRCLWVTDVPLTVLEAAVAPGPRSPQFLDRAPQRQVRFETVHRAHCRNFGRRGSAATGALLRAAADRAGSQAERVAIGLLRRAEIGGWRCGYWVDGYELDLAFRAEKVAIEVDGWAWHTDVARFRRDRQRQNALVLAGWTILRFTWHDLTTRPDAVVAEIRAALAARPAA